jgi:hypothetical protein
MVAEVGKSLPNTECIKLQIRYVLTYNKYPIIRLQKLTEKLIESSEATNEEINQEQKELL